MPIHEFLGIAYNPNMKFLFIYVVLFLVVRELRAPGEQPQPVQKVAAAPDQSFARIRAKLSPATCCGVMSGVSSAADSGSTPETRRAAARARRDRANETEGRRTGNSLSGDAGGGRGKDGGRPDQGSARWNTRCGASSPASSMLPSPQARPSASNAIRWRASI